MSCAVRVRKKIAGGEEAVTEVLATEGTRR